jgi:uncharacterized protein YeaO (DUF488 family)
MLKLKRAYEPASPTDGIRLLVERLWPRGLSKESLKLDGWIREVGPTTALRKWFDHDPEKWPRFRARYFRELDSRPDSWRSIASLAKRRTVTLVYSSHDEAHNNAVALREYLQARAGHRADRPRRAPAHRPRRVSGSVRDAR